MTGVWLVRKRPTYGWVSHAFPANASESLCGNYVRWNGSEVWALGADVPCDACASVAGKPASASGGRWLTWEVSP